MNSELTLGDVLAQIPQTCGLTRGFLLNAATSHPVQGLNLPLRYVMGPGDIASLPLGVNANRLAMAIASAYLAREGV